MHAAVIETGGNQRFLFSTNRLREQVGASELIHRSCTHWVIDAVCDITTGHRPGNGADAVRQWLSGSDNGRVDAAGEVEVVTAVSGKAVLVAQNRELLAEVIWKTTSRALVEAPGLVMHAAISEPFRWGNDDLGCQVAKTYRALPGWTTDVGRFQAQPPLALCGSSGDVATDQIRIGDDRQDASAATIAKRAMADAGLRRMIPRGRALGLDELERVSTAPWHAVIHADGNGLGKLFMNLHRLYRDDRSYADASRLLSIGIEQATINAFALALGTTERRPTPNRWVHPVVPIVLGGDDLTVVCDGAVALDLIEVYLKEFSHNIQNQGQLVPILRKAIDIGVLDGDPKAPALAAAAGIAYVKPHHPFWAGYELAAGLAESAKTVKREVVSKTGGPWPVAALDLHVLLDSRTDGLVPIRRQLQIGGQQRTTRLWGGPWIVADTESVPPGATAQGGQQWWTDHGLTRLRDAVEEVRGRDEEDRRRLPSSQLHRLRAALREGPDVADPLFHELHARYGADRVGKLGYGSSIYNGDGGALLLDALSMEELA